MCDTTTVCVACSNYFADLFNENSIADFSDIEEEEILRSTHFFCLLAYPLEEKILD